MKQKKLSLVTFFVCLVLLFNIALPFFAKALDVPDLTKTGSISFTLSDKETKKAIVGAKYRLYFVAAASVEENNLKYDFLSDFEKSAADIESDLSKPYLAVHLASFAKQNEISYTLKQTDSNGYISFEMLSCGIYLVVPDGAVDGYMMGEPFLVTIPLKDEANSTWSYDVNALPKIEDSDSQDGKKTYLSVKKLWQGSDTHPLSVTVLLLCDGQIYDTKILNEDNGWYYRWENLDAQHTWHIVESAVPDGYKVDYDFSENTVTVVNTYVSQPSTEPVTEPTTDGGTTQKPSEPSSSGTSETTSQDANLTTQPTTSSAQTEPTTKKDELADTGQFNWPVPVFAISGMILFSLGWSIVNLSSNKKKGEQ